MFDKWVPAARRDLPVYAYLQRSRPAAGTYCRRANRLEKRDGRIYFLSGSGAVKSEGPITLMFIASSASLIAFV